jgi:hypothetical protein
MLSADKLGMFNSPIIKVQDLTSRQAADNLECVSSSRVDHFSTTTSEHHVIFSLMSFSASRPFLG